MSEPWLVLVNSVRMDAILDRPDVTRFTQPFPEDSFVSYGRVSIPQYGDVDTPSGISRGRFLPLDHRSLSAAVRDEQRRRARMKGGSRGEYDAFDW